MDSIKCSLVGLGRIGSSLEEDKFREKPCTHAGAIVAHPECELWGGCDIEFKKCEAFSRKWRCQSVFTDITEMLSSKLPDILIIATPPDTHLNILKKVLTSKIKVIICEKPLAVHIKDALAIVQLSRRYGIKILTNHERRYSLDYLKVYEHIKEQTFGDLLSITARLHLGRNRILDEILLNDGTHLIDIIQFLTSSPLKKITSHRCNQGAIESVIVYAKSGTLNKSVPVVIEVGSGCDYLLFELDLIFSRGRIRVGNGIYEEYESKCSPYYESINSLLKNDSGRPVLTGYFINMLQDAVDCFKDPLREPVSSAWDGYSAQLFINTLLKY